MRQKNAGLSLLQVHIVVALLTWLIALAAPLFEHRGCGEPPISKARQDLDTLRNAIHLYETRFRPLQGDDLGQIVGITMQELPRDPWGEPYHLDTTAGILFSFGADNRPGGQADEADIVLGYR